MAVTKTTAILINATPLEFRDGNETIDARQLPDPSHAARFVICALETRAMKAYHLVFEGRERM